VGPLSSLAPARSNVERCTYGSEAIVLMKGGDEGCFIIGKDRPHAVPSGTLERGSNYGNDRRVHQEDDRNLSPQERYDLMEMSIMELMSSMSRKRGAISWSVWSRRCSR
jgi:hypothetical protein